MAKKLEQLSRMDEDEQNFQISLCRYLLLKYKPDFVMNKVLLLMGQFRINHLGLLR
jgi:hypothetical protein